MRKMCFGMAQTACGGMTMGVRKRCCCNCGHCERIDKGTYRETRCDIDGHYIGYVECFEGWCRRWKKDHTFDGMEEPNDDSNS